MHIIPLIGEGIIATFAMTVFDYAIALFSGERIKVVKILGTMLTGQTMPDKQLSDNRSAIIIGILAHYSIGILFSLTYHLLWQYSIGDPSIPSALVFGLVSGIIAVAVWRTFIAVHRNPPAIPVVPFLCAIFGAHIVFALTVVVIHRWLFQ